MMKSKILAIPENLSGLYGAIRAEAIAFAGQDVVDHLDTLPAVKAMLAVNGRYPHLAELEFVKDCDGYAEMYVITAHYLNYKPVCFGFFEENRKILPNYYSIVSNALNEDFVLNDAGMSK